MRRGRPDPLSSGLARGIAPSPAIVDEHVMEASRGIAPAAIVELVTFVALLQLLHRPSTFYPAPPGRPT